MAIKSKYNLVIVSEKPLVDADGVEKFEDLIEDLLMPILNVTGIAKKLGIKDIKIKAVSKEVD